MVIQDVVTLEAILSVTAGAVIFSVVVFFGLMVARFLRNIREAHHARKYRMVEDILLVHLTASLKNLDTLLLKKPSDMIYVAEVTADLVRMIKGVSQQRLLMSLEEIGLKAWVYKKLQTPADIDGCTLALSLARYWPSEELYGYLRALLKSPTISHCYGAMTVLAVHRQHQYLPDILAAIAAKEQISYLIAYDVLVPFGAPIIPDLCAMLQSENSLLRLKKAAILTLGRIGETPLLQQKVAPFCGHQDRALRLLAYQVCAMHKVPVSLSVLGAAATDEDVYIRISAARCAGSITPLPVPLLRKFLQDKQWLVALETSKAIFESGEKGRGVLRSFAQVSSVEGSRVNAFLTEQKGRRA